MIMALFEKKEYIDNDFRKSELYHLNEVPTDPKIIDAYILKCVDAAGVFMKKYRGRGQRVEEYVKELVNEWMDDMEKEYRKIYHKEDD